MELQPIDAQTNGPQLFYGLRYHTRIVKPDDVETFHDQVGYWLWEPATGTVIQTLSIPRGQTAMAVGRAAADARTFRLQAVRGSETNGIVSNPFLEYAFRTESYTITVSINVDGTWSYEQDTVVNHPGSGGTVPPYGSQHAPEDRRAYAQPHGASVQQRNREIPGALEQARSGLPGLGRGGGCGLMQPNRGSFCEIPIKIRTQRVAIPKAF
mgnify:CR=1 FL=1